ncbi:nuclear transport factor 2 family protein [Sphingobium sp. AN558]|uniref:nuclear transport factor 2 family protein n=1 Tax=Sphingobium sp. AN558 TaxID=3133442 RepID=UPI0030BD206D
MLALQEISDRLELQDLIYAYASAIDSRDFAKLNDIFAPNAHVDAIAFGGPVGDVEALLAWIYEATPSIGGTHHMMANHQFVIAGDRATGRVMGYNPMDVPAKEGASRDVIVCGLFYLDEYARISGSWRIASRIMQKTYIFRVPLETSSPAQ